MTTGYTINNPIFYDVETDIPAILEKRFGRNSGDYFVLTQQTIKDPKTQESYEVVLVEDATNIKHTLCFKKR